MSLELERQESVTVVVWRGGIGNGPVFPVWVMELWEALGSFGKLWEALGLVLSVVSPVQKVWRGPWDTPCPITALPISISPFFRGRCHHIKLVKLFRVVK